SDVLCLVSIRVRIKDGDVSDDERDRIRIDGGVYVLNNVHICLCTKTLNPEFRPVYRDKEQLEERLGKERAENIVSQTRNLCLYPNVYVMDQFSTQIRVTRPISVDRTEVTIYCFGPKGESEENREIRLRQYEDFFNVSGMGTADDLEEFRACQEGYGGRAAQWNDLSRGAPLWIQGPDENAKAMGMKPLLSGERSEDEGLYICQHQYWLDVLQAAVEEEKK